MKKIGHQDYFALGDTIPTAQEVVAGEVGGNLESESLPEPERAPSVISGDVEGTAEPSSNPERPPIPEAFISQYLVRMMRIFCLGMLFKVSLVLVVECGR